MDTIKGLQSLDLDNETIQYLSDFVAGKRSDLPDTPKIREAIVKLQKVYKHTSRQYQCKDLNFKLNQLLKINSKYLFNETIILKTSHFFYKCQS